MSLNAGPLYLEVPFIRAHFSCFERNPLRKDLWASNDLAHSSEDPRPLNNSLYEIEWI